MQGRPPSVARYFIDVKTFRRGGRTVVRPYANPRVSILQPQDVIDG